ncbi:MAG: metallophosphoesterase family protein [Anaerolineaceae bacterium]|nr:metallophosphoesterase family protein [Anaerolineaceae bacterium]
MRTLIFSDIHANLTALEAVLSDAGKTDQIWCLGDLVGYGPDPNECVTLIQSLPSLTCILGNHDAAAIGLLDTVSFNQDAKVSASWTTNNLTPSNIQFIKTLKPMVVKNNITLAHGSPRNPIWEYILDSYTAKINLENMKTRICFVGHTHLSSIFIYNEKSQSVDLRPLKNNEKFKLTQKTILNPGSLGQPRDNDPRAAYAILDTATGIFETHRVPYDIPSVQQRIIDAGLPERHAMRLTQGW